MVLAIIRARVVFPVPGGPKKIRDESWSASMARLKPIAVLHKQCNKLLNELVGHFGLRKGDLLAAALALSLHGSEAQS